MVHQVDDHSLAAVGVDGHITLFYGDRRLAAAVETVVARMQAFVNDLPTYLNFRGAFNSAFATERYAWIDIMTDCELFGVVKRLVTTGIGDGRAFRVWLREEPWVKKM